MNYREFVEKAKELGWVKTKVKTWNGLLVEDSRGTVAFKNHKSDSNLRDFIDYEQVKRIGFDKIVKFMDNYNKEVEK